MQISAVRASHFVATHVFNERMLTLITFPDQRIGHGFLDDMTQGDLPVLLGLLTSEWDVRLFLA